MKRDKQSLNWKWILTEMNMVVFARRVVLLILIALLTIPLIAQTRCYDPLKENYDVIQNQGWTREIGKTYQRLPDRAESKVRKPVWDLSKNSAGISIHFYTNAKSIEIKYEVTDDLAMMHMPATGKSGIDLYMIDSDGKWHLVAGKFHFNDTITYTYDGLSQSKYHKRGNEYCLFFPLYNSVKWMNIGIPNSAEIKFIPSVQEKPIVAYGTSIAQGGCASRPGMGWTNIVSRTLNYPVINLAFSGNGLLENEMIDLIDEIDASLYIYDCLPNMTSLSSEEVMERVLYGVKKIRVNHETPILLVDHIGYTNYEINESSKDLVDRMNNALNLAYDSLINLGIRNVYYLKKDSINIPMDGCVDNIHPNDLGMKSYADAYEKIIREILHMPLGDLVTMKAVSQRREPDTYEWKERHGKILKELEQKKSQRVIIGNSITHYWGGSSEHENGNRSWKRKMEPYGFLNLGCGWDRIENVIWRIYHGELDGCDFQEIVLMIGTNNLELNSDDEILEGLLFLLKQIEMRQPGAKIKMVGLLPRRDQEDRIKIINKKISRMSVLHGYTYLDISKPLLLKTGKIDETLFLDGLHPNEKGYLSIVDYIVK